MFDKLQIHSLVTSVLLLPALALIAHPSDFSFENSTNYPIHEFSISSNRMENWKECILAENTIFDN